MSKIPSVLWTCNQGLSTSEQDTARANIAAAKNAVAMPSTSGVGGSDGLMSAADKEKLNTLTPGGQANVIETVKVDGTALTVTDKAVNIPVASYDSLTNPVTYTSGCMSGQDKEKLDNHGHGFITSTGCIDSTDSMYGINTNDMLLVAATNSSGKIHQTRAFQFDTSADVVDERLGVSKKGSWLKFQPDLQMLEVEHNATDDSTDGSICTGSAMYNRAKNAWEHDLTSYYNVDWHATGDYGLGSRNTFVCDAVDSSYCSFTHLGVYSEQMVTTSYKYLPSSVTVKTTQTYRPFTYTMDQVDELLHFRTFCVAVAEIGGTTGAQTLTIRNTYVYRYDTNEIYKTLTDSTTLTELVSKGIQYTDDFMVIIYDVVNGPASGLPTGLTHLDISSLCGNVLTSKFTMRIFNPRKAYTSVAGDDGHFQLYLKQGSLYPKIYSNAANSDNQGNEFNITIYATNSRITTPGLVTTFTVTSSTSHYTYGTLPMVFVDIIASNMFLD